MSQFLFVLEATANAEAGQGSLLSIVILYGAIFGVFWFFLIRPQRKKQKAIEAMQSSVSVGDSVLTTGGLYGKVIDIVNDNVLMIEFGTNKSVRVPVKKEAIASVTEPDLSKNRDEVKEEKTKEITEESKDA